MSVWIEKAILFIMAHNEAMVQAMVVLVVAWGAFILGTWIFGKTSLSSSTVHFHQTSSESSTVGADGAPVSPVVSAAVAAEAALQVAKLQSELVARTQEVETLKAKASTSASEAVDLSSYIKKIEDLEGKLAEYEILEDDIADLSLYKEENARLKSEIQKLGGEVSASPTAAAAPAPAPAPVAAAAPAAPVAAAAAPAPAPVESAPPAVEIPQAVEAAAEKSEAIVQEFAQVVEQTKPATPEKDGDDLLSEFAASLSDSGEGESSDLDTDKMMAEMASLEGVQDDGSALEGDSDMDKMAAEASKLLGS